MSVLNLRQESYFADNLQPYVHSEFSAIKDTVLEMSQGTFRDLFTMGENRHLHRTVLAYVNQVFQQISGINLITYYAATIYQEEIKLSGLTSRALAAANGTGTKSPQGGISNRMTDVQRNRILRGLVDRCLYHREIWSTPAVGSYLTYSSAILC